MANCFKLFHYGLEKAHICKQMENFACINYCTQGKPYEISTSLLQWNCWFVIYLQNYLKKLPLITVIIKLNEQIWLKVEKSPILLQQCDHRKNPIFPVCFYVSPILLHLCDAINSEMVTLKKGKKSMLGAALGGTRIRVAE